MQWIMDQDAFDHLALDPDLYKNRPWNEVDAVFTWCRRRLQADPDWRCGPARVREVAREGYDAISPHGSVRDKTYCDLGCGTAHPYGISAIMYLNGARSTIALDLYGSDRMRSAEALADLLADCAVFPDDWHWSDISRADYFDRISRFNLKALYKGDLEAGLSGVPLKHVVTDIHNPVLQNDTMDLMTSRAVLEHFLDFDTAVRRLFSLMHPGGVAYHHIDLVDHRAYSNPALHYWSFLAEDDDGSDGLVNRLRSCEIRSCFEKAGFEILRYENRVGKMPDGFHHRIRGRFSKMSEQELSVTGVFCVLRKP